MKKLYKLYLLFFVFALSYSIGATNYSTIVYASYMDISSNWKIIDDSNGIITSIRQVGLDQNSKIIYIKFENRNDQEINFSWSLIDKSGKALKDEQNKTIAPNSVSSLSKDDQEQLIVSSHVIFDDVKIIINTKN